VRPWGYPEISEDEEFYLLIKVYSYNKGVLETEDGTYPISDFEVVEI
jgi:hypothetical protein